mgnify:CR=1 FL=1
MMITVLINIVDIVVKIISLLVIVYVVLSYFMSPFHPIRQTVNRIIEPMLNPIRRILPSMQGIDFSPFVLILAVQLIEIILINILRAIF